MSNVTDLLIEQMREARDRIISKGRALRLLVELSEDGRRQRAKAVVLRGRVKWVRTEDGAITAGVAGSKGTVRYAVHIGLLERQDGSYKLKGHLCSCYDHGRAGACKHVLAVVGKWILDQRGEWLRLKEAEDVLSSNAEAA